MKKEDKEMWSNVMAMLLIASGTGCFIASLPDIVWLMKIVLSCVG